MQNHTYLVKNRCHVYYYRHITPPDIIKLLPQAKKEVRFSLQTKELKTALSKARYHRVQFDLFFELTRKLSMNLPIEQNELAITCQKESENLQKFSQQINLLFEKRNKIKNIFKKFPTLNTYRLKDISLRNHHEINNFIRLVDLLDDPLTIDHEKYIDSIHLVKYNYYAIYDYNSRPKGGAVKSLRIEKLPIIIKPKTIIPFQTKHAVKRHVKEEKKQCIDAISDLIQKHDIDAEVEHYNTQIDDTQTINLTNVTVDNTHDMQNLLALVNAIQNDDFSLASNLANNIITDHTVPPLKYKISFLFKAYLKEKRVHWVDKTYNSNKAILDLFIDALEDLYVEQLTDDHARHWLNVVQSVPANRNKLPEFRDKTVDELLAMSGSYEAVSISTSKDYLQVSKAAFSWAKQRKYLPYTFLKDMRITAKPKKISKENEMRRRFSQDDLNNIFSLPRFTEGNYTRTYYCWFPLLGLYTGARAEELAQMELQDVYKEKKIWVININDDGDKQLKTINSRRVIPIHKTLIKLGFIKYVNYLKDCYQADVTCNNKLFPELERQRDGYSRKPRDRFISFLEKNKLKQDKQAFHSFRHTFADIMKQDDIPEVYCAAIIGHKHSNITYSRYGKEFSPDKTQKVINSINPLPDSIVKKIKPFLFPIEFRFSSMMSHTKIIDTNKIWANDKNIKNQFPKIFTKYQVKNNDK